MDTAIGATILIVGIVIVAIVFNDSFFNINEWLNNLLMERIPHD